jgi:hypothetical protein
MGAAARSVPSFDGHGKWHGQSTFSMASDSYFETLGIRLLRGRTFTRQEADLGAPVAVVSQLIEKFGAKLPPRFEYGAMVE